MQTLVDARTLSKLRWRCRRGLLENDLFIERFFARHAHTLTQSQAQGLEALMELPDNDLLRVPRVARLKVSWTLNAH
jgi:antitoxin CptB